MIGDELIQASLITKIKSLSAITSLLTDANEVRELQWQGDTFTYPNIRLDLESNDWVFDEQERCQLQYCEFSIYVFTEDRSSKKCSQIKSAILTAMSGLGFSNSTYGVKFSRLRLIDNVPAVRESERIWRSQVKFGSRIGSP